MKKTIKLKIIGFWDGFDPDKSIVFRILNEKYNVVIVDDDPEYIICSVFGEKYEYIKYPQVRIMISGENYIPDFNLIDYSICSYPIIYQDRNYRFIQCFLDEYDKANELNERDKNRNYSADIIEKKPYFANFIVSHESENGIRGDFFKALSKYKRVESCGTFLNNMPDGKVVNRFDGSKYEIQKKSKFTICFESTKHDGFITEKIIDAFYADSIPIYFGSSDVTEIFNPKSFIDCSAFDSFEDVIERVIEIDQNDDLYLEMLNEPVFRYEDNLSDLVSGLKVFLYNIFDQAYTKAYRRSRVFSPFYYEDYIAELKKTSCKYQRALIHGVSKKELWGLFKKRVEDKFRK